MIHHAVAFADVIESASMCGCDIHIRPTKKPDKKHRSRVMGVSIMRRFVPSTSRSGSDPASSRAPSVAAGSRLVVTLAILGLAACAANSGRFAPMPGKSFPAKEESFEVAVFESILPSQSFERIARIDVQMEMPDGRDAKLEDAIPELKRQARRAGADAVIDIRQSRSRVGDVTVFQVSAMGIRYSTK
jgi:hypothetical protein